jgi:hypothetical protein
MRTIAPFGRWRTPEGFAQEACVARWRDSP